MWPRSGAGSSPAPHPNLKGFIKMGGCGHCLSVNYLGFPVLCRVCADKVCSDCFRDHQLGHIAKSLHQIWETLERELTPTDIKIGGTD